MTDSRVKIIILGAGFAGLCVAARLQKAGIHDFVVLEKSLRVGGTWRDNIYPGVACDIPSHLYSLSFDLNADWTRAYPSGWEIQNYIERIVKKCKLDGYLRLGDEVRTVSRQDGLWRVTTKSGREYTGDVVVSGLGGLHEPKYPDIEGLDKFAGTMFHSARWNHDASLEGKRIGIVGTGSSAVQIAPAVCERVARLTIFQRTPAWVLPRIDFPFPKSVKKLFRALPLARRLYRWFIYLRQELWGVPYTKKGSRTNMRAEQVVKHEIEKTVRDPELVRKLVPDYPIGCKRACIASDFYPMFNKDNVRLVTEGIRKIDARGVVTADGEHHEFDVLILATGFKPFSICESVEFAGESGVMLKDLWKEGIAAHRTMMVPGFPNLFIMLGPNSGLGHNSVLLMIEAQANYFMRCIKLLLAGKVSGFNPRQEAMQRYNSLLQEGMKDRVFFGGCNAWYNDERDHNYTFWPHGTMRYWWQMRRPRLDEFQSSS